MEGVTSLDEEKYLKAFFLNNRELPEEFSCYRYLFDFFETESSEESKSYISIPKNNKKNRFVNSKLVYSFGLAASVVIFLTVALVFFYPEQKQVYAYIDGKAVVDKQKAIEETKKALLIISNNYNEATENLNYLKVFNDVTEQVTKKY